MTATQGEQAICHVLADVGGTNARFAWVTNDDASLRCVESFACAEYEQFEEAVKAYFDRLSAQGAPKAVSACFAIAASVHDDLICMTNSPWQFSRRALADSLGIPVAVLNDFSAQAWCLSGLLPGQVKPVQSGGAAVADAPEAHYTRTVVGPGTGFGGASLLPAGIVVESEPGHVSFGPVTEHELALLKQLWQRIPRVSVEHLLSGPGLANLYWANACLLGEARELAAPAIVAGALAGDALCEQTVRDFVGILGSVCGDIALSMGSLSGFYLSGAILEKMDRLFDTSLFCARFNDKGPFSEWCRQVPVARITAPYPGLLGCAAYSRTHYSTIHSRSHHGSLA
ncbi:MAG: glucokinase [Pseudomonadales bacterium]|nr:glucokinase [Pseudomonadales bacterium]